MEKCGCAIVGHVATQPIIPPAIEIIFCPLHAAAGEMQRKLQAAEEMARALRQCRIVLAQVLRGIVIWGEIDRACEQARIARVAWENAGK